MATVGVKGLNVDSTNETYRVICLTLIL